MWYLWVATTLLAFAVTGLVAIAVSLFLGFPFGRLTLAEIVVISVLGVVEILIAIGYGFKLYFAWDEIYEDEEPSYYFPTLGDIGILAAFLLGVGMTYAGPSAISLYLFAASY